MHRVDPLPASFSRYRELWGVVEFAVFDDADGDPDTIFKTICSAAPIDDREALRAIGFRLIDDAAFYGDWYDPATGDLLLLGEYTFEGGRKFRNAPLRELEGLQQMSGGSGIPEAGAGGQFAYAFAHPPYTMRACAETQQVFEKIKHFILPTGVQHEILDWTSPDLPKASAYFEAGMEWWGIFLFSIYVPAHRRLTIIWASSTD
ncbi:MAG: hypothetical protein JNL81_10175 [Hyphomonadaceae bacterium]|nr:hypothetical protein [Hyphomonadaceae bacterium]